MRLSRLYPVFIANLVPLIGIVFLSWDAWFIMFLYTFEVDIMIIFFFFLTFKYYRNKVANNKEFFFIISIIAFMCASLILVWSIFPMGLLLTQVPKSSIMFVKYETEPSTLWLFRFIILPALGFIVGHGISFLGKKDLITSLENMSNSLALNAFSMMAIVFIGAYLTYRLRIPMAFFAVFIVLKMIADYYYSKNAVL
jgi:hypothetical protein